MTSVWVHRDSKNHAVLKRGCEAWNTHSKIPKVRKSNKELIGPKNIINLCILPTFQGLDLSRYSSSTASEGMATCETSYRKLFNNTCIGSIGRNGRKRLAPVMLIIFPKFELAPIFIYLIRLPNVLLPSITPSSRTARLFCKRMMSADSFAISTALLTDIPISDAFKAGASFMPSPK